MEETKSPKNGTHPGLPMARIKVIMKSSPDVEHISPTALYAMTKATELFVSHLTTEAYEKNTSMFSVDYKSLADVVNNDETLEFLQEVVPHKITVRDYLLMTKKQNISDDDHSDNKSSE
nr:chromatin accessibility complex protein 1-like [Ciona intestinalis]|eukprot:XP_002126621.1 chromatin accessibility complex protein 1-like [Ciona intestinalis]